MAEDESLKSDILMFIVYWLNDSILWRNMSVLIAQKDDEGVFICLLFDEWYDQITRSGNCQRCACFFPFPYVTCVGLHPF